jgi:hypothetical protein
MTLTIARIDTEWLPSMADMLADATSHYQYNIFLHSHANQAIEHCLFQKPVYTQIS